MSLAIDMLRAGSSALVKVLLPQADYLQSSVEELTDALCDALWGELAGKSDAEKRLAFDELARLSPAEAAELASRMSLGGITPEAANVLRNYIASLPMTVRRGLSAPGAGGHVTRLSSLPQSATELRWFVPLRPPLFASGQMLQGTNYRLRQLLGQGGFGEVWLADHMQLTTPPVALKFFPSGKTLQTELESIRRLGRHPHIATVVDTLLGMNPPCLVY